MNNVSPTRRNTSAFCDALQQTFNSLQSGDVSTPYDKVGSELVPQTAGHIFERLKLGCAHFAQKVKMFIQKQRKGLAASVCVRCVLG